MALSNRERVDRALHVLADSLAPYVEREMDAHAGASWQKWIDYEANNKLTRRRDGSIEWEVQPLLQAMIRNWNDVFKKTLGHAERSLIGELVDVRNKWAHQRTFSYDDTHRALDSVERLLQSISAGNAAREVNTMRQEVLRVMFDEQRRVTERRQSTLKLEQAPKAGLKPWREVILPHPDVATGRYAVAEFAADLSQVVRGEAGKEYGDPAEFFRRTFLTNGLSRLLRGAMQRLGGGGGDPVVELQTNFGGGKTHSMLALYHMARAENPAGLTGLDQLMADAGVTSAPRANRAVFVGTSWSPGEVVRRPEGVEIRTIWGHLAYELGGVEAYRLIAESDARGMAPGSDLLVDLFKLHTPCLILIDEWVAFVRQLYGKTDTPAGSFENNLTFAQSLSEAVKAVPGALLVASLPASDIEIGGEGGQTALTMLKNTFGRVETSWRPATTEEGFEIVRRRLFEPIVERENYAARDAAVKAFVDMYREAGATYPGDCGEGAYRDRMIKAYPIHPELFERLNNDWGALDKFQRTRGVLRLMASVINVLWEENDRSLMIMPSSVPLDDANVLSKFLDYLPQPWDAVIGADIDGNNARSYRIDRENPNLQRFGATRRVARTIFLASAPHAGGRNPGIDDRRIRLGCVQPGETAGTFGDALRRLADQAMHLYVDGNRYWFDLQPTVTRLAEDRARDFEAADVWAKLIERLGEERRQRGPFAGIHVAPQESADVPDEPEARLVILGPDYPHTTPGDSKACAVAEEILARRGQQPRIYSNTLLFLAPDGRRLEELERAMRASLAWHSISRDREVLQLTPFQIQQAESKASEWEKTVASRVLETWIWAMAPHQPEPVKPHLDWSVTRLSGLQPLAERAGKRFESDEALLTRYGPKRLRAALDSFELWRGKDHVSIRQLAEDFAKYLYLPRLSSRRLIEEAVVTAVSSLICDHVAYAEGHEADRYEGLVATGAGHILPDPRRARGQAGGRAGAARQGAES